MKQSSKIQSWRFINDPEYWKRLVVLLWLLFGALVLLVYYQRIWEIFRLGPQQWIRDNYSIEIAARFIRQVFPKQNLPSLPPFFSEAAHRAGRAFLGVGIVLCSAQVFGAISLSLARVRLSDWIDALLYRTAFGLAIIAYLSLGLSWLSRYSPTSLRIVMMLSFILFVFWQILQIFLLKRSLSSGLTKGLSPLQIEMHPWRVFSIGQQKIRTIVHDWRKSFHLRTNKIWVGILFLAFILSLIGALAPETEYDALWYHLWLPKQWLQLHYPLDFVNEYISLYPLNWELDYGAAMALGGVVAAKLLHWACLSLTSFLVFQITRKFFPKSSPYLAAVLFVSIPTVLWEATTAYNDLALALYSCLALYALLRFIEQSETQWLLLGSISLGLALAIKHLALFILLLSVIGLSFSLFWKERNARKVIRPVLMLIGISLLFPLPWYLRSWSLSGNPFFPDLYHLFGSFPPERWSNITELGLENFKAHFGDARTLSHLLLLPWNMTIHSARYGGSLGPIFLLLLPGMAMVRKSEYYLKFLTAFAIGYLVLWASPFSSFQLRFLLPITPILAVMGAIAFSRLAEYSRCINIRSNYIRAFLAVLIVLNLPPLISLHESDRQGDNGWLTEVIHEVPTGVSIGFETKENYLSRLVHSYQAWKYINQHLPQQAKILTFSGGDHLYSKRERIWSDSTIARPATWGAQIGQEKSVISYLHQLGVTHLLVDEKLAEQQLEARTLVILEPEILNKYFVLEYQDTHFALYRFQG